MIFYWELSDPHSYPTLHCLWPAWQVRATLSPHPLPILPILHVLNLLCCSSRSVIKLFNSFSLPSDLLLRAFRSSLLPLSTPTWASLARQSYSLTPPPTQSPNPQCSQLTVLFFKVSYKTIQFLFPAQWFYCELTDPYSYHFPHCLWPAWQDRATLSSHPLPDLQILIVLNLLCCSSRSVIKLFNSSSLPSDILMRAFRFSFLPVFTLSLASLARQSFSLTPRDPIPKSSMFSIYSVDYVVLQGQL